MVHTLESFIEEAENYIEKRRDNLYDSNKLIFVPHRLMSVTKHKFDIANYCLNKNPKETISAKKNYFQFCRGIQFEFHCAEGHYPKFSEYTWDLGGTMGNYFETFLLSDHDQLVLDFFQQIESLGGKGTKYGNALAYSLKYILLGQKDKAQEQINICNNKFDTYTKGRYLVFRGILEQNNNLVNQGINHCIKQSTRKQILDFLKNYSPQATALAKLAIMNGMNPDISSPLINKGMIVKEKVDYEDIDDLYKRVGVEPIVHYSLKNY
jgi:hypothetical protein